MIFLICMTADLFPPIFPIRNAALHMASKNQAGKPDTPSPGCLIQESTHVFLCDYFELIYKVEGKPDMKITPENSRMIVDGEVYEVMLIHKIL